MQQSDIIVIGAGMAGCSAAATLARTARVTVLEQEAQPGYHSTGRSAATLAPFYGPDVIQTLTAMSAPFLNTPPDAINTAPFTAARGEMTLVATADNTQQHTAALIEESLAHGLQELSIDDALALVPLLRTDRIDRVLYSDQLLSIDVDALHQYYIRQLRQHGGELICNSGVTQLEYISPNWHITTASGAVYNAPLVINAAGAWADTVAQLAGLPAAGIQPKRRTAALVPFSDQSEHDMSVHMSSWPMVLDIHEQFYCIPFGSGLMISPADATPVDAHDVWPEDLDIATGIDHFQQLIDYDVPTITHQWAGLRSFAADGNPVVGFDPLASGFFWLAGQGGYGIQTAPALAEYCHFLITRKSIAFGPSAKEYDTYAALEQSLSPCRLTRNSKAQ